METVKVSTKFQVVIPQTIRKSLNVQPGQKVQVIPYGNRIELIPLKPIQESRGFLKGIDTTVEREPGRVWILLIHRGGWSILQMRQMPTSSHLRLKMFLSWSCLWSASMRSSNEYFNRGGEGDVLQAIAMMNQGRVIDLDVRLALSAAKISVEIGMPMADSIILATAQAYTATLWTQDDDFKGIDGVRYIEKK